MCIHLRHHIYRGIGKSKISIILTVISLGTRVLLSHLLSNKFGRIGIWYSVPIGWFIADVFGLIYLFKTFNKMEEEYESNH